MKIRLLAVVIMLFGLGFFQGAKAATIDSEEQEFVDLLNELRRTLGHTELKLSNTVTDSAEYFAQDSANYPDNINSDHTDSRGETPTQRGDRYGYYFLTENLGWGQETAEEIYASWRDSYAHYVNMTIKEARSIGVSRVYKAGATKGGATTEWYWVAVLSDEGVERLNGNNLKEGELNGSYLELDVKVKKNGKGKKYHKIIVTDLNDDYEREVDRDLTDKKGRATLFSEAARRVKVKARDIMKGKTVGNKTITWDGNDSVTFNLGDDDEESKSSYKFRLRNRSGKVLGKVRTEIWAKGKFIKSRMTNSKSRVKYGKRSLNKKIKKITGSKDNRRYAEIRYIQNGRVIGVFDTNLKTKKRFEFRL